MESRCKKEVHPTKIHGEKDVESKALAKKWRYMAKLLVVPNLMVMKLHVSVL